MWNEDFKKLSEKNRPQSLKMAVIIKIAENNETRQLDLGRNVVDGCYVNRYLKPNASNRTTSYLQN